MYIRFANQEDFHDFLPRSCSKNQQTAWEKNSSAMEFGSLGFTLDVNPTCRKIFDYDHMVLKSPPLKPGVI